MNTLPATSLTAALTPSRGLAAAAALAGSLLLALSAKAEVPFWPVPMTLQTLAVLTIAMTYGARLGMATIALYLMEGALGLPVFAGPVSGLPVLAGPTGGFLTGFFVAAGVAGWLGDRGWGRSAWRAVTAIGVGHVIIFAFGLSWLTVLFGLEKAIVVGLTPFWTATVLKTLLGALLVRAGWTLRGAGAR